MSVSKATGFVVLLPPGRGTARSTLMAGCSSTSGCDLALEDVGAWAAHLDLLIRAVGPTGWMERAGEGVDHVPEIGSVRLSAVRDQVRRVSPTFLVRQRVAGSAGLSGEEPDKGPKVDLGKGLVVLWSVQHAVGVVGTRDPDVGIRGEGDKEPHARREPEIVSVVQEVLYEASVDEVERGSEGHHPMEDRSRDSARRNGDGRDAIAGRQGEAVTAKMWQERLGEGTVGVVVLAGEPIAVFADRLEPQATVPGRLPVPGLTLDVRARSGHRRATVTRRPRRNVRLGHARGCLAEGAQQPVPRRGLADVFSLPMHDFMYSRTMGHRRDDLQRAKDPPLLPPPSEPLRQVASLSAQGRVVAVARLEPGLIRKPGEGPGFDIVQERP